MSMIYDNWERLVAAVLKKEQLWQLFHDQSRSPSISSESSGLSFSFGWGSSIEDAPFSSPERSVPKQKGKDNFGSSSILVEDQSLGNLTSNKKLTFTRSWKRALKIEVPKLQLESHVECNRAQDNSEYCRNISPRMASPTSSSRLHPRAGGGHNKPQTNWPEDAKQKGHPLPLPPVAISRPSPVSRPNSAATSPTLPTHSPERAGNPRSPSTRWKKGKLLGRGAVGDIYLGFDSEKGEMCAMKEVKLSSDDAMSKQRAMVLEIELSVLSQLRHPNIVQYYGAEKVDDNFYIYSEYVSGGSISRILQEYGKLGESAICSYTHQILSGLAYLHSRSISHRDIKAATILVDPNGRIKLASFGIEKHIIGQSHPSLLRESPYWMAPEVIMNPTVRDPAIDIWSLGCTVLEIATSKPPMSQFKQEVAMLKVAYHKELPTIPDHLSDDCKDFVRHCLQWNPKHRATAAQLLEHPFCEKFVTLRKTNNGFYIFSSSCSAQCSKTGGTILYVSHYFDRSYDSQLNWIMQEALTIRIQGDLLTIYLVHRELLFAKGLSLNSSLPLSSSIATYRKVVELAAASDQELLGGAANGQLYGQSMLADRVSHQLSKVPTASQASPSMLLSPLKKRAVL
ncbi:UNVERIFIED_CONTAM: Mitogen-activated protein kinase kinase kinase YODA [Sesamum calycinum]|uniref:Mitogen-activated protein kinase kinase kinase YODA n=1 Tax=Sesamum calycinum TaxID=2727403 RepID=A0AAW2QVJ2_9LAMI